MITQIALKKYILTRITADIVRGLPRILLGVLVFFLFCLVGVGQTQEAQEEKEKIKTTTASKGVQGEVSGISSNFIAILYSQDEKTSYEMALTIDKDTKVERKKSLREIGVGDTVSVKYEEKSETHKEKTEKGEEKDVTKVLGRVAKVISFVNPAPKELQSLEEPVEPETAVLNTEEPEEGKLPIKGIKGQ